jgi:diguanylate cyclase (GGDEF)-like protein
MRILDQFNNMLMKLPHTYIILICLLIIAVVGFIDVATGSEISISLFFLIPISIAAWYVSLWTGLLMSLISAIVWLAADLISGHSYSHSLIPLWNAIVRLGFFIITGSLLNKIRLLLDNERNLARLDSMTGVFNGMGFKEEAEKVLNLSARHGYPFTLIYMDLDNFKKVNDISGHFEGDRLLKVVGKTLLHSVRSYDCVARMGGDEFSILLPSTNSENVQGFITKLQSQLSKVVNKNSWPVSFSIGAVTFVKPPATVDQAVQMADHLMYKVKNGGKNSFALEIWNGNTESFIKSDQSTLVESNMGLGI